MSTTSIAFDELTHTYTCDGAAVPSVTQVLKDVGIIDYSRIPEATRMEAMENGRLVHLAAQFYDEGDLGYLPEALAPYLAAWKRFREETDFVPELIEHRGYQPNWGYAGTVDRVGKLQGKPCILDIKTGVAPWWVALQLTAYAQFFESPARYRRLAVELHADATYRVIPFRSVDFPGHWSGFLAALTVWKMKQRQSA